MESEDKEGWLWDLKILRCWYPQQVLVPGDTEGWLNEMHCSHYTNGSTLGPRIFSPCWPITSLGTFNWSLAPFSSGGHEKGLHGSGVADHQRGAIWGGWFLRALHRDWHQRHGVTQQWDCLTFCLLRWVMGLQVWRIWMQGQVEERKNRYRPGSLSQELVCQELPSARDFLVGTSELIFLQHRNWRTPSKIGRHHSLFKKKKKCRTSSKGSYLSPTPATSCHLS